MTKTQIAIAGLGKIAFDQHIPAITATGGFGIGATVSRNASLPGAPSYRSLEEMLDAAPDIAAIALCTPPQVRYRMAQQALRAGLDVLLEKPPAATLAQIEELRALAADQGRVLFATWHSRFAVGIPGARAWLADKTVSRVTIRWREDVRRWHPGQSWIWQPGGLGVFDPGINALSILTEILPDPVHVQAARLEVPVNCDTPITAQLEMRSAGGAEIAADFDFRQTGPQSWDIHVTTEAGDLALSEGGAQLAIGGRPVPPAAGHGSEYEGIYRRFAALCAARESDVDITSLTLVADAFLLGERRDTEPFHD